MDSEKTRTFVISLPRVAWKNLFGIRAAAALTAIFLLSATAFWWFSVHPYLWIENAHVEAFSAVFSSDMEGRIVEIGPEVGEAVKRGDLLFALDADLIRARQKRLHLSIESLNEQIRIEKVRMEKAMQEYVSASAESELGMGRSDSLQKHLVLLEDAQLKSEKAAAELQTVNADLTILELQAKKMRWEAPFDAIVLNRSAHIGSVVSFGHPVYTICDPKRIWIEVEIPERAIRHVEAGAPVGIRFPAYPKQEWNGHVLFIGPSAQKGVLQVKISLDNQEVPLKPGLSAIVRLKVR